jgi:hypothetical protein
LGQYSLALRELRRALKRGGTLVVTTPNLLTLQNRFSFLTGGAQYDTLEMPYDALEVEQRIGHAGTCRVFSMPELVDLLERTDFHICYHGYMQISFAGEVESVSVYALRGKVFNFVAKCIPQVRNQLLIVASRN